MSIAIFVQLLNVKKAMSITIFAQQLSFREVMSKWIVSRQLVWPPWQLDDDIFAFNIGLGKVLPSKD